MATATPTKVTFGDASGRGNADASLDDLVNENISIKAFRSDARQIKGKDSFVTYIELAEPITITVDKKPKEVKTVYTWSDIIRTQLGDCQKTFDAGNIVTARVTKTKTANGSYLSLN